MKKILLAIVTILAPLCVFASFYDVEIEGIYYKLDKTTKNATVVADCIEVEGSLYPQLKACYSGDVVIPESFSLEGESYTVTSIGGYFGMSSFVDSYGAFQGCTGLTSITIPKTIRSVGAKAFDGCTSLNSVYISDLSSWCCISFDVASTYSGLSTNPLYYAHNLYLNGELMENLIIPDDITHIYNDPFVGANIKSVVFHKNVEEVDGFNCCENLKDVYVYGSKIMFLSNALSNAPDKTLHIRERYKDNFQYWVYGKVEYIDGIDFKLIYQLDGNIYKEYLYEKGETIQPEPEPEYRTGYTFSGWSEIPETMPAHDVTVAGTFTINNYKLIYKVDGEEYKSYDVEYNSVIIAEPEPTRKGMTFSGWSEIPEKMPAQDVTVTGSFSWLKLTKDNIIYEVTDTLNNYCHVLHNGNASGEIKIITPVEIDGCEYKVTEIANKAFYGCKDITKIEIPAAVTTIGERAFANIDKLTDVTCLVEDVPKTDRTAFENSYLDYVTLHVPAGSIDKYKSTAPWSGFKEVVAIEGTEPQEKCATPTIDYKNGKLVFECETDGSECVTTITSTDVDTHYGNEVEISYTYNISAYAKADGYANSDVVTAMLIWIEKDDATTALNEKIEAKAILVQAHDGTIRISSAEPGAVIEVYNVAGTKIASVNSQHGTTQIATTLNVGEVAIVKIGKRSIKVIMR